MADLDGFGSHKSSVVSRPLLLDIDGCPLLSPFQHFFKRNADELMNICSDADARRHQTQSLCSLGAAEGCLFQPLDQLDMSYIEACTIWRSKAGRLSP